MTSRTSDKTTQARQKIRTRFNTINISLFLLTTIIMVCFMLLIIGNVTKVVSQDYAQLYSTRVIGILNSHLGREIALMTKASGSNAIREWFADEQNENKRQAAFEEMTSTLGVLESKNLHFGIEGTRNEYNLNVGDTYASFAPFAQLSPDLFDDIWYFECLDSPDDYELNVDIEKQYGRKRVWLNYKVEKDGVVIGALATGLIFDQVLEELFGEYDNNSVRSFVINEYGIVQMDSALEGEENLLIYENEISLHDMVDDPVLKSEIEKYLSQVDGMFASSQTPEIINLAGKTYRYASVAPIAATKWSVVSLYNSSALFNMRQLWPLLLIIFALFVAYMLVSSMMSRRMLIAPINRLVESISQTGPETREGNPSVYGLDRNDEFGVLARTLQNMLDQRDAYNAQLIEATMQANAASEAKSSFLASMSHEIRTPINAIVGMTHIGKRNEDLARKDDCFEKIEIASSHLLGVINDILDISKIEANKFELSYIWFNLERMLRDVSNVIVFRMIEKDLAFTISVDYDLPDLIEGDNQRLSQVVTNIMANAVKFTPEGGKVHLDVRLEGKEDDLYTIRIAITDNGIGIAKEDQARLFRAFEQSENGTSRQYGGTGLGLAISKRIVEIAGGSIGVESELGKGSTFYFSFPAHGRFEPEMDLTPLWHDLRVLVVSDDPEVTAFFKKNMAHLSLACDFASSIRETLALTKSGNTYDLCFVEYYLPDGNGARLAKKLAAQPGTHIVMLSPYMDRDEVASACSSFQIVRVIPKPLFPSEPRECLEAIWGAGKADYANSEASEVDCFLGRRILLAEDVEINREIFCSILEHTGVQIDCAEDGKIALDMYAANPDAYDLIMMDVQMPRKDGYQTTIDIRKLPHLRAKTLPIIAMTANVFREDVEKCLEVGMNDHIGKPIDYDLLMRKLRTYLD
ncbi:response regulator [Christensenellaceae bacterium OttesenSCG-928-L17]|nr:response regulator [Christensenellaceae bacterium OttesenSCG-928-L17]